MRHHLHTPSLAALAVLALAPALYADEGTRAAEETAAEEESGALPSQSDLPRTLAERIPAVTRPVFAKSGRLELAPSGSVSLNDPFFDHAVAGLGAAFHIAEWLSIGVAGDYYTSVRHLPPVSGSNLTPPRINRPLYSARLEATVAPLYGKVSLLAEHVLHFDVYLIAGAGMLTPKQGDAAVVGVLGVGQHYFLSEWLALKLELRDQMFRMPRNVDALDDSGSMQNLLSATVGVCFYLPAAFEHDNQ